MRNNARVPDYQLPALDPLYDAIGRVATAWAHLELSFSALLVSMLHAQVAEVIAVGQSYKVLHDYLQAVLRERAVAGQRLPDEWHRDITDMLREADELAKARNHIVHGVWGLLDGDAFPSYRPRRNRARRELEQRDFTLSEVHDIVYAIINLADRADVLSILVDPAVAGVDRSSFVSIDNYFDMYEVLMAGKGTGNRLP